MFKECKVCGHKWATRQDFIDDQDVWVVCYQANFKKLTSGLLYFNHTCKNTVALSADLFADLYDGPKFSESKTGSEACPGYCLHKDELRPCPAECECAYIREIVQLFEKKGKVNH